MRVTGLDHRGIRTRDLETTKQFYADILGLEIGHRPGALGTSGYWLYAGEAPIIHLIEESGGADPNGGSIEVNEDGSLVESGGQTHLALTVENGRTVIERLRDAGVPYWDRLFKSPVMYQIFVRDPNGLLIELIDRNPGDIDGPICKVVE